MESVKPWNPFQDVLNLFQRLPGTEVPLYHVVFETILVILVIRLLFAKSYRLSTNQNEKLTKMEEEELIREWTPEPLAPPSKGKPRSEPRIITGKSGPIMEIDGEKCYNLTSFNFINLIGNEKLKKAAVDGIHQFGVGSCGPRGFYGTMNVHNDLEKRIADFLGREEAVLYSFLFATVSSAIPSYSKRGDIIFYLLRMLVTSIFPLYVRYSDEAVSFSNQRGIVSSRSQRRPFKHNDMQDLERLLQKQAKFDEENPKLAKITRRFVVVEGLYINTGNILPLPELIELKYKYKFRILLDESYSFGVLGKSGKGLADHYNLPTEDIDLMSASLEHSVATSGGFCCGDSYVRLSGLGYCFSASLPPLFAKAALAAFDYMEAEPKIFSELQSKSALFRKEIAKIKGFNVSGNINSPIVHLFLSAPSSSRSEDEAKLEIFVQKLQDQHKIIANVAKYLDHDELHLPAPSIRLAITTGFTNSQIKQIASALKSLAQEVF
ncbi:Serine palmitoyltransferase 1 [Trichoplax sp. H2]|nr:Serine palmitoyltransferase 1 [Trichoplax sp. H2]|eukprot:RDD38007.1 Serine palmitoyltransferase 1 [Trichoplax sp. H2]